MQALGHNRVLGWTTLTGIIGVTTSTSILQIDINLATVIIAALINSAVFAILVSAIVWIFYLVFGTRGIGHYQLKLWYIFDIVLGEVIAHVGISMILWMSPARTGDFTMFTHTGNVTPFYALYDQFLYIIDMLNGGGIVDNIPVGETARAVISLQLLMHSFVILIVLSALVATMLVHTDERAQKLDTLKLSSFFHQQ